MSVIGKMFPSFGSRRRWGYVYTTVKVFGLKKYSDSQKNLYSDSLTVHIGQKNIWINCMFALKQSAFLSKHGHKIVKNLIGSNAGQPKNFFPFFFIIACSKKMTRHWLLWLSATKTGVLAVLIQSIQILPGFVFIRICQQSKDFLLRFR